MSPSARLEPTMRKTRLRPSQECHPNPELPHEHGVDHPQDDHQAQSVDVVLQSLVRVCIERRQLMQADIRLKQQAEAIRKWLPEGEVSPMVALLDAYRQPIHADRLTREKQIRRQIG